MLYADTLLRCDLNFVIALAYGESMVVEYDKYNVEVPTCSLFGDGDRDRDGDGE